MNNIPNSVNATSQVPLSTDVSHNIEDRKGPTSCISTKSNVRFSDIKYVLTYDVRHCASDLNRGDALKEASGNNKVNLAGIKTEENEENEENEESEYNHMMSLDDSDIDDIDTSLESDQYLILTTYHRS